MFVSMAACRETAYEFLIRISCGGGAGGPLERIVLETKPRLKFPAFASGRHKLEGWRAQLLSGPPTERFLPWGAPVPVRL